MRLGALTTVLFLLALKCTCLAQSNEYDLRSEIKDLKQGQEAIRKELMELKSLLSKIAAPTIVPQVNIKGMEFELGKNPVRGGDAAKLIMIEFTDYQ
jgi:hypothetical protein